MERDKKGRGLIPVGLQIPETGRGKRMYGEGKTRGVEANDINYSQSPGLKYPKNSRICSWTEAPVVGSGTKCLCLNKGFTPSRASL